MKLTLYAYWRSSASWRVRIALGIKEQPYELMAVNLREGEQGAQPQRDRNPMEQVPTLVIEDGGRSWRLNQSLAICRWLDDAFPNPPLVPQESNLGALVWELAEIINAGTQPLQNLRVLKEVKALGGDADGWAREAIRRGLEAFAQRLPETPGPFSCGERPSLADVCLVPQLHNARRFDVPLANLGRLVEIDQACSELPAFFDAHPDQQPDRPS